MAHQAGRLTATLSAPVGRSLVRRDAVGWLTAYLVLLLFIPSRLVVGPLGSAGAPSMLFGLGSLLLWLLLFLGADRRTSSGSPADSHRARYLPVLRRRQLCPRHVASDEFGREQPSGRCDPGARLLVRYVAADA